MEYHWSDASALWELEHGADGTDRKAAARLYLEMRLDGYDASEVETVEIP